MTSNFEYDDAGIGNEGHSETIKRKKIAEKNWYATMKGSKINGMRVRDDRIVQLTKMRIQRE